MRAKSCLITGASGFIGRNLCKHLHREGYRLICLGRSQKPPEEIENIVDKWIRCDLSDTNRTDEVLHELLSLDIEYFFHLASRLDTLALANLEEVYMSDIISPVKILALLAERIEYFCFFSSSSVVSCDNLYANNKFILEHAFRAALSGKDIPYSFLRISSVYGPGMPKTSAMYQFLSNMKKGHRPVIYGDPLSKRDYVFVDDVVAAAMTVLKNGHAGVYNISSSERVNLLEMIDIINGILGTEIGPKIYKNEKSHDRVVDNTLAKNTFGFSPIRLKSGIQQLEASL